jgi:hypothetical protein
MYKILSKQLKLPKIHYDYIKKYKTSKKHKLINSDVIIPQYYFNNKDPSKYLI